MNYAELRAADITAWQKNHDSWWSMVMHQPAWGDDLSHCAGATSQQPESLFALIHKTCVQELAKQQNVDWIGTYGATSGNVGGATEALIAAVLAAVISILVPPAAPFAGIMAKVIEAVLTLLVQSISGQLKAGSYGDPAEISAQIQTLAMEAQAA